MQNHVLAFGLLLVTAVAASPVHAADTTVVVSAQYTDYLARPPGVTRQARELLPQGYLLVPHPGLKDFRTPVPEHRPRDREEIERSAEIRGYRLIVLISATGSVERFWVADSRTQPLQVDAALIDEYGKALDRLRWQPAELKTPDGWARVAYLKLL